MPRQADVFVLASAAKRWLPSREAEVVVARLRDMHQGPVRRDATAFLSPPLQSHVSLLVGASIRITKRLRMSRFSEKGRM